MITTFRITNFKRLQQVELQLGNAVVFIGPNNSGKTTALQALALWDIGWRRWVEKRDRSAPAECQGVTINRRDLSAIPVPHDSGDRKVPAGARSHAVVFLPPMSGLAEREYRKEKGEINVLIGEGQTAQVLRNLCWQLFSAEDKNAWNELVERIETLFHIHLDDPRYVKERSELSMTYRERSGVELDLSSSGRGCQQVLLLLSFLLANPGSVSDDSVQRSTFSSATITAWPTSSRSNRSMPKSSRCWMRWPRWRPGQRRSNSRLQLAAQRPTVA